MTFKTLGASATALLVLTSAASAVTVKNTSDKEISIGVGHGANEKVEKIEAGNSARLDCKEQCGITGPWGFSWMAKGDDTISTNGESLVTETKS